MTDRLGARMKIWITSLLAIASGILASLAFPPLNASWLCWIAWTPLIVSIWWGRRWGHREWLRLLLLGYAAGISFFCSSLLWLCQVSRGGWLALGLYLGVYLALWALFVGTVGRPKEEGPSGESVWLNSWNNLRLAILGAAAWTALEWGRGILFTGFGWNSQGVALYKMVPLIQIADITGVHGLSFLIVMANLIAVMTVKRFTLELGKYAMRPHFDFTFTMALIAGAFLYGAQQIFDPHRPNLVPIRIACIQADIPLNFYWNPAANHDQEILRTYQEQSAVAVRLRPDLLIWPEAATPHPALIDPRDRGVIDQVARSFSGDFLFGTVHFSEGRSFNSAVLFNNDGMEPQVYSKIHLVPFGEYIPLRRSFPLFAWIAGTIVPEDFTSGSQPLVFSMRSAPLHIAPLICFEDTLGSLARLFVLKRANFFAVITNDGWFGKSAGSEQHLANAVFRTAEFKLPMVRCSNTGVTCLIDRFGSIIQKLENIHTGTFGAGILAGELRVPARPTLTFYARFGDVFSAGALGISSLAVALHLLASRRRPSLLS